MLVLSRKLNEAIVIGENIVVTVIDIRGDKIRLGIEAPRHVAVHRREFMSGSSRPTRKPNLLKHSTPDIRPD